MNQSTDTIRRLAVLVDSLDSGSAGQFLNNVPTGTADQIRRQVVDLGKVSKSERENVLQQFLFAVHGVQDTVVQNATGDRSDQNADGQFAPSDRVRPISPRVLHGSRVVVDHAD